MRKAQKATIQPLVSRRPGARDLCALALEQYYTAIQWRILRTLRRTHSGHFRCSVAYEMTQEGKRNILFTGKEFY